MKNTIISILVAGVVIAGAIIFAGRGYQPSTSQNIPANNVIIENGKQIIEIKARGGYQPRVSVAKLGIPTVLRFETSGTFDCSSSVRIPSLGISKYLPQTGTTDIDLGSSQSGILQGSCGMGMYPFEVDFQN